jgi:hypothetical protein
MTGNKKNSATGIMATPQATTPASNPATFGHLPRAGVGPAPLLHQLRADRRRHRRAGHGGAQLPVPCRPRAGTCSFLQNALASRLSPFLSAETPLDYPFMLLRNFWGLILVWLAAIGFARHAYQNPRQVTAASRAPVRTAVSPNKDCINSCKPASGSC